MTAEKDTITSETGDIYVAFKDKKVDEIRVFCAWAYDGHSNSYYKLQGLDCTSTYQQVLDKFGQPSFVSTDKDQEMRILSYPRYNVFFGFKTARVIAFGVY